MCQPGCAPWHCAPHINNINTTPATACRQTYYKLNYVDRRVDAPEQRVCEDVPKLAAGLADLTRELVTATVDALFYAVALR